MAQLSPLNEAATNAGAAFAEYSGWAMPSRYGPVEDEYAVVHGGAAFVDVSHRSKIDLTGADRISFVQNLCTNHVAKLSVGSGCEAFLTTAQAKIVARLLIFAHADILRLDADPGLNQKIIQHLDRYLITERVELSDRTFDLAQLHLVGSQAKDVLSQACDDGSFELSDLQHEEHMAGGINCTVRRNNALGTMGYDLHCGASEAASLWRSLQDKGAKPVGLEAYEILRIEAGTPEYGKDIDETNLPQEVNRDDRAVSFTKGCYLGQETVARIKAYGHVNRYLVGLSLERSQAVPAGAQVFREGHEIGKVTSSVFSPRIGAAIGLAYVRRGHQEPDTALEVSVGDKRIPARVTALPFAKK